MLRYWKFCECWWWDSREVSTKSTTSSQYYKLHVLSVKHLHCFTLKTNWYKTKLHLKDSTLTPSIPPIQHRYIPLFLLQTNVISFQLNLQQPTSTISHHDNQSTTSSRIHCLPRFIPCNRTFQSVLSWFQISSASPFQCQRNNAWYRCFK